MFLEYKDLLLNYLLELGINVTWAKYLSLFIELAVLIVIIVFIDRIIKRLLVGGISRFARRSQTKLDDYIVENNVPKYVARVLPLIIAYELVPYVFSDFNFIGKFLLNALEVYTILLVLWTVRSLLNSIKNYFRTIDSLKDKPYESYIQVFMIFAWIFGAVMSLAILTGTPVWKYFTALGAASAVIILVFQDSIKGFVASIQVSVNDMVRIGDWVTFSKYGADGDVTEINLATVKVQNFDKTITTIPTYSLISEAFQNWRGMEEDQGRRIKRHIRIKQQTIKFLNDQEVEKLKSISRITNYLNTKEKDIKQFNEKNEVDKSLLINGRNLTNFGVYRKYVEEYLMHHSAVNKKMTLMVRHLQPDEFGIPLEIYCFSADKRWVQYEYIMADIFDHVISAAAFFDLEIFESEDTQK